MGRSYLFRKAALQWVQRLSTLILSLVFLITIVLVSYSLYLHPKLPSVTQLDPTRPHNELSLLYKKTGKLSAKEGLNYQVISYQDIPPDLVLAIIAAEDKNFLSHEGVDYTAIVRAVLTSVAAGKAVSGASTVTMQVAKNLLLTQERSLQRKLLELMLARQIESRFSKSEIMQMYLNGIYFGNQVYGIDAAAHLYFQKPVHELNLAQLATLAGLPKAPSRFNPIASPEAAEARRNWVLNRMRVNEFISESQYTQAKSMGSVGDVVVEST